LQDVAASWNIGFSFHWCLPGASVVSFRTSILPGILWQMYAWSDSSVFPVRHTALHDCVPCAVPVIFLPAAANFFRGPSFSFWWRSAAIFRPLCRLFHPPAGFTLASSLRTSRCTAAIFRPLCRLFHPPAGFTLASSLRTSRCTAANSNSAESASVPSRQSFVLASVLLSRMAFVFALLSSRLRPFFLALLLYWRPSWPAFLACALGRLFYGHHLFLASQQALYDLLYLHFRRTAL
jgi:hypothetical protein